MCVVETLDCQFLGIFCWQRAKIDEDLAHLQLTNLPSFQYGYVIILVLKSYIYNIK